jgi:hypothetical protein
MALLRLLSRIWKAIIPARYRPRTKLARDFDRLAPQAQQDVLGNHFRSGL